MSKARLLLSLSDMALTCVVAVIVLLHKQRGAFHVHAVRSNRLCMLETSSGKSQNYFLNILKHFFCISLPFSTERHEVGNSGFILNPLQEF